MTDQSVLQPGTSIKPRITLEQCKTLVRNLYGLQCYFIEQLNGYDDLNYKILVSSEVQNVYIEKPCENGYVVKILNSLDSQKSESIEGQTSLLIFLNENEVVRCPIPVKNKYGQYFSTEELESGKHIVRLLEFIPGKLLHQIPQSKELSSEIGRYVGKLDLLLQDFRHPSYESYKSIWMLNSVPRLKQFLFAVGDTNKRILLNEIIENFEERVLKHYHQFEKGLIHGDANEQNIIANRNVNGKWNVAAILDFGDTHSSCYLFEIAITMTYIILLTKDLDMGGHVLAGYLQMIKIPERELSLLKVCIEARLTQSLVLGAYSFLQDPGNDYILTTAKEGWNVLALIRKQSDSALFNKWKSIVNEYSKGSKDK